MSYSVAIIIVSDRASTGEREDQSIPVFKKTLQNTIFNVTSTHIVSDTPEEIEKTLKSLIAQKTQLILTSGGTGCAPRDNTPEVTAKLVERPTPGVDEALRAYSATKANYAMYARGISGIADSSFIINLPGSPKAVRELVEFLLPTIEHPLKLIADKVSDCANEV